MVTMKGLVMEVIDVISASQMEEPNEDNNWRPEQVIISNDPIEVTKIVDSRDSILVRGWSHISGDMVTYIITPDTQVEVWRA